MKNISILVPESSFLQAVADPQYLFSSLNDFLVATGKKPLFNVQVVAVKKEVKLNNGMFTVHADKLLKEVKKTDLIFIPALSGDMETAISKNKVLIPWITEQYEKGAEIASLCVGAFLLAATGLLNGKKCSTHWGMQNKFRKMFPLVEVVDSNIITEEHGIYSSGGGNTYWNLLLHLVEKYTDRKTAILAAKYMAVDIDRSSQSAFAMFQGQKEHSDPAIKLAQEVIEQNIHERISVDGLADKVTLGRRSFERRFKQATGHTVLEYIHRVKIESAKRSFENSQKNINEIMFDVGYTDAKTFRTIFKKITGSSPIGYRNKYNKQPMA
ncbi:MAG: helix-turn-helix domain-containing protein [Ferruginibacter sp.]